MAAAREIAQEFIVEARLGQRFAKVRLRGRVVREHLEHVGVLVAEQEFELAVLQRLESGRRAQHRPEFHVLRRRQRLQHAPLLEQLALHLLDAREHLQRRVDVVRAQARDRFAQLMDDQLHPELGDLVLDDEQDLVVMRRIAQRLLLREQRVEAKVAAVRNAVAQVKLDALLERTQVFRIGHGDRAGRKGRLPV